MRGPLVWSDAADAVHVRSKSQPQQHEVNMVRTGKAFPSKSYRPSDLGRDRLLWGLQKWVLINLW